jgi:hypothetical protein
MAGLFFPALAKAAEAPVLGKEAEHGGNDESSGWHSSPVRPALCLAGASAIKVRGSPMSKFYEPDLTAGFDNPFVRDGEDKLIRRSYWLDMNDHSLVMAMTRGIGANLTNDEKRAHLIDLRREHLIDQVCIQEILPPEK